LFFQVILIDEKAIAVRCNNYSIAAN